LSTQESENLRMDLSEFLKINNLSLWEFSQSTGISYVTLKSVINGREPMLSTAIRIEDATFGKVTCREIMHSIRLKSKAKDSAKKEKDSQE